MSFKKRLRSFDDTLHIVTGKRLKNIAGAVLNTFGDEIIKKVSSKVAEFFGGPEEVGQPEDSPYRTLDIYPDADDFVVRAAYKGLMKKYHPDGEAPDEEMAKKVNQAYEQICLEREIPK